MTQPGRMMMTEDILGLLGNGISKHYMDDPLSIIWCNPAFYKMLGYKEEDFLREYPDFRRYYGMEPGVFDGMKACFEETYAQGRGSAVYQAPMTVCNGESIWVEMNGTIVESPEGRPANPLYPVLGHQ